MTILKAHNSDTGEWEPLVPSDPALVQSVAGKTGNVTLDSTDVGLGNVDNTSDANKPVSTAQQTALNGKANTSHTHAQSDVTGLIDALAGKAATSHTHSASDVSGFDEAARDAVGAALVAGSNVTITVNDEANTITIAASGGGGGASLAVDTVQAVTDSLAANTGQNINLTMGEVFRVVRLVADKGCRVRLYASDAARTADVSRSALTAPTGNHGCVLDAVIASGGGTLLVLPQAFGFAAGGNTVYARITNLEATSQVVTVDFDYIAEVTA